MAAARAVKAEPKTVDLWADVLLEKGMEEGLSILARPRTLIKIQRLSSSWRTSMALIRLD